MYPPEVGKGYTLTPCPCFPDSVDVAELPVSKEGKRCSYHVKLFAAVSDIDEVEIAEEREAAALDREFAKIVHEYENA